MSAALPSVGILTTADLRLVRKELGRVLMICSSGSARQLSRPSSFELANGENVCQRADTVGASFKDAPISSAAE